MRLAILDDDRALCDHVTSLMLESGHDTTVFRDGKSMLRDLRRSSFDLLLLDWILPDISGMDVLSWVREHLDPAPPVIMITCKMGEADIVAGLTLGADDYVTKPIQDSVLKARVEALLRRVYGKVKKDGVEVYGEYAFDLKHRTVTRSAEPVVTTAKEFALAPAVVPQPATALVSGVYHRSGVGAWTRHTEPHSGRTYFTDPQPARSSPGAGVAALVRL